MAEMNKTEKVEKITKVLHERWNPIGGELPSDEYASYAPHIVDLITHAMTSPQPFSHAERRERALATVTAFLSYTRIVTIGLAHESRWRDADGALACVNALAIAHVKVPAQTEKKT